MSHDIRSAVLAAIARIAPEVDPATLKGDERLRQQVDIDSMDFLNMVIDLHRELGVDIPESDYGKLATVDDIVNYLNERVRSASST
ncbi:MAG TPA: phosphopantetheine-binding protein [Gemmatimonadaceae bacterium]